MKNALLRFWFIVMSVFSLTLMTTTNASAAWLNNANNVAETVTGSIGGVNVSEIKETSGLIASNTYPGWYYSIGDVWKSSDSYAACNGFPLNSTARNNCIKGERAKVWAIHMDATSHLITAIRSFPISNSAWSLDRFIGLNGDWEDITEGPVRTVGGVTSNTLLIAATGDSTGNPETPTGSCDSRRIIELNEPNPSAVAGTPWTPTVVYDLDQTTIKTYDADCNIEAAFLYQDNSYVYLVSKGTILTSYNHVFKRLLTPSTGRQNVGGVISSTPIVPTATQFQHVGQIPGAAGSYQISGASYQASNDDLVLIDDRSGCNLLRWHSRTYITTTAPEVYSPNCGGSTGSAEGIAYTYSTDPLVRSVHILHDMNGTSSLVHRFDPWQ